MTPSEFAGKNISQYRQESHLSLTKLAENSHLSVSRLHDIEGGTGDVTAQEFFRIAKAMDCDPCVLLLDGWEYSRKY